MEATDFDCSILVQALSESVKRNLTDGLLLSGGLDTAILAYLAANLSKPGCVTVALRNAPAPDVHYAAMVASRLGLRHYVHYFGDKELEEGIRAAIRIMKTFDPMEVRNSAAIYVALKVSRDKGMATVMTGDGCDELLGGYSFLFGLSVDQLDLALKKMWDNTSFSSVYLARDLGLEASLPYLAPQFKEFAMSLDAGLKVRTERGQIWGKWILRKAFEGIIPPELAWRMKAPIEVGCGTTTLPSVFDSKIPDLEFGEKKGAYLNEDGVVIRSKEHLYYYEIYRSTVGSSRTTSSNAKRCPGCGANVKEEASFCRTCGAYPI